MAKQTEKEPGNIESLRLKINNYNVHYLKAGSGPPVLLVHGGASDARDWIPTMLSLGDRFSFYAPDLIGFGRSERQEKGYYLSDFSDFLLGFIDALQLDRPALVGHSFGARICLDATLKNQARVSRLVISDASGLGKMSLLGSALFTGFWALRKAMNKPQPFPRFLSKEGDDYNNVNDEVLRRLTLPTLIVWKRLDPYMPLKHARRAARLIPGSRLVVVPGYGHAPSKQNRELFNKLLVDFLLNNP
jgi:pimeloyl-ACP methyl ester carboxylesterase